MFKFNQKSIKQMMARRHASNFRSIMDYSNLTLLQGISLQFSPPKGNLHKVNP